eukprot:CAMPEP_0170328784 /NCGR_PEP_ID=MMETSP0116_2-20130129/65305_1 /TAXON_ID=400756 /ORGANISM="Durinskia baltica, Strain CSIRO CS-38" /LENGTH=284 /DNA_ID=CAMNT_0010581913 /DNA_START=343 /DNA_END=1194 /DNA_ORIENTATION=-
MEQVALTTRCIQTSMDFQSQVGGARRDVRAEAGAACQRTDGIPGLNETCVQRLVLDPRDTLNVVALWNSFCLSCAVTSIPRPRGMERVEIVLDLPDQVRAIHELNVVGLLTPIAGYCHSLASDGLPHIATRADVQGVVRAEPPVLLAQVTCRHRFVPAAVYAILGESPAASFHDAVLVIQPIDHRDLVLDATEDPPAVQFISRVRFYEGADMLALRRQAAGREHQESKPEVAHDLGLRPDRLAARELVASGMTMSTSWSKTGGRFSLAHSGNAAPCLASAPMAP